MEKVSDAKETSEEKAPVESPKESVDTKCTCEYNAHTCKYYVKGTGECLVKLG